MVPIIYFVLEYTERDFRFNYNLACTVGERTTETHEVRV